MSSLENFTDKAPAASSRCPGLLAPMIGAVTTSFEKSQANAQIALAWLFSKDVVTAPIIGASKPGHLEDAAGALSVKFSNEDIRRLEEPYRPHPVLGHS